MWVAARCRREIFLLPSAVGLLTAEDELDGSGEKISGVELKTGSEGPCSATDVDDRVVPMSCAVSLRNK
jgi:hypothetical protein